VCECAMGLFCQISKSNFVKYPYALPEKRYRQDYIYTIHIVLTEWWYIWLKYDQIIQNVGYISNNIDMMCLWFHYDGNGNEQTLIK
jgi:hypothetical protein